MIISESINSILTGKPVMKRTDFLKSLGGITVAPWAVGSKLTGTGALRKPKRLQPGDMIGLTAPAGIVFNDDDYTRMVQVLTDFGFRTKFGSNVRNRHGYLAGTDRERAENLNQMFVDPEIDGIMAVRGGWGCSRILPYLDFKAIARNPKVYCGFSDNTTLHHAFMSYCGFTTFHGPNGNSDWTDLTKESFESVIMKGEESRYRSKSDVRTLQAGSAEGRLIGGNLTILTTTLGTSYQPDFRDAILFVEDIGERTYKIDRMLAHLKQAGALNKISGFIFGKCTDCSAGPNPTFSLAEVIEQYIKPLNIPAMMNADIGHEEDNFTIPAGGIAELDAGSGEFWLKESSVI